MAQNPVQPGSMYLPSENKCFSGVDVLPGTEIVNGAILNGSVLSIIEADETMYQVYPVPLPCGKRHLLLYVEARQTLPLPA